jgi:hypothetical protein
MEVLRDLLSRDTSRLELDTSALSNPEISLLIDMVTGWIEDYFYSQAKIQYTQTNPGNLKCSRRLRIPDQGWITLGVRRWRY